MGSARAAMPTGMPTPRPMASDLWFEEEEEEWSAVELLELLDVVPAVEVEVPMEVTKLVSTTVEMGLPDADSVEADVVVLITVLDDVPLLAEELDAG